jgi:hypothetical protein
MAFSWPKFLLFPDVFLKDGREWRLEEFKALL